MAATRVELLASVTDDSSSTLLGENTPQKTGLPPVTPSTVPET